MQLGSLSLSAETMQYSNTCETVSSTKGQSWSLCISPSLPPGWVLLMPRDFLWWLCAVTCMCLSGHPSLLVQAHHLVRASHFSSSLWSNEKLNGSVYSSTLDSCTWSVKIICVSLCGHLGHAWGVLTEWKALTIWILLKPSPKFHGKDLQYMKRTEFHFLDKAWIYNNLVPTETPWNERRKSNISVSHYLSLHVHRAMES